MLYRSTDRLCRCGAPMEYLAHSASLQSGVKSAPSKPGIKHLEAMGSMRSGPKRAIAITASTSGAVRPLPTWASLEVLAVRAAAQDHADAAQKDES